MKHLALAPIALLCLPLVSFHGSGVASSMTAPAAAAVGGIGVSHRHSGYLGVNFENLTSRQRANLDISPKEGVAIAAVDHDAPAGKAGLRPNDVIVEMNGKRAQHAEDLAEALHKMDPGQTIVLDIVRAGHAFQVSIVLADRALLEQEAWSQHFTVPDPQQKPTAPSGFFSSVPAEIGKTFSTNGGLMSYIPGTPPYTGITLDVMTPQLARYFGLRNATGLLIKNIDQNSPASRAGLRAGDVICRADDLPMLSRSRWNHALRENRHEAVKLQILRDRHVQIIVLTLAASKS